MSTSRGAAPPIWPPLMAADSQPRLRHSLLLDRKLHGHWALHFSSVRGALHPRPSSTHPAVLAGPGVGPGSCRSPPLPPTPSHTEKGQTTQPAPPPAELAPLPLQQQQRDSWPGTCARLAICKKAFLQFVSSAPLKKMGTDGLTEHKMPEGVPEPRIPNPGLL